MDFEITAQKIIEKTLKSGATECDVVLAKASGKSISCRKQNIEDLEESNDSTIGIRALVDQKQAFVSSSEVDDDNIETLVNKCVSMAKLAPVDDTAVLGDSSLFESEIGNLELHQSEETNTEALIDSVKECEEAALSVPGISNSEGAGASYSQGEFYLATSNGFQGGYKSSTNSISCSVLAGEGQSMERDYDYSVSRHFSDLRSAKEIGTSAANKTLKRLNPKKIKSTKKTIEQFSLKLKNNPKGYIAQPTLDLSSSPTLIDNEITGRRVDLRPYCLIGKQAQLCPGGLTRVALNKGSYVVNSSQGGGVKDTWVLAD